MNPKLLLTFEPASFALSGITIETDNDVQEAIMKRVAEKIVAAIGENAE